MEKHYFGYIRVSTPKQGEKGVSLVEQRAAIDQYSKRFGLTIDRWFEEQETAAKLGRPLFNQMIRLLKNRKACGVVIHKIDRSARNLKDWADLGGLIDTGVEVHFANESLDLHTRGGRLSADIQAVVAADYIRNLREETKKGFYGRLKQGVYPIGAPIGYLDRGGGKVKEADPRMGPLVQKAFRLYATAGYSLTRLVDEMYLMGLRNRRGGKVTLNGMSTMLNNPFYIGVIRLRKTGEIFAGAHRPLIGKSLFDQVQAILDGKTVTRTIKHECTFRRMLRCALCRHTLTGEIKKGHVYYRCHTRGCATKTVREERVEAAILQCVESLHLDEEELELIQTLLREEQQDEASSRQKAIEMYQLQLDQLRARMGRMTDAYVDGVLDKTLFEERKGSIILEEAAIKEKLALLQGQSAGAIERLRQFFELVKAAPNLYKLAVAVEKRDLVKTLTSNLVVSGKNVAIEPHPAVFWISNRQKLPTSRHQRETLRTCTWRKILKKLVQFFNENPQFSVVPVTD